MTEIPAEGRVLQQYLAFGITVLSSMRRYLRPKLPLTSLSVCSLPEDLFISNLQLRTGAPLQEMLLCVITLLKQHLETRGKKFKCSIPFKPKAAASRKALPSQPATEILNNVTDLYCCTLLCGKADLAFCQSP